VLVQAMVWMGLPQPPAWQLVAYFACIGMLGVGVGMLYTPVLVDRLRLAFPSGLAVANILRALTDTTLLRRSVQHLGGGAALGLGTGLAAPHLAWLSRIEWSASTFGAGMVGWARASAMPAVIGGVLGWASQPFFVRIGWLEPGVPFARSPSDRAGHDHGRRGGVDLGLIFWRALPGAQAGRPEVARGQADWQRVHRGRLWLWVAAGPRRRAATCCWDSRSPSWRSPSRWCSCSRWSTASRWASATPTRSRRPSSCRSC
jgi:hypothetical protein